MNGTAARRAALEAPRSAFAFHDWGIRIVDPAWRFLAALPGQERMEVESTGFFTDRRALVERIEGDRIILRQPGWRNNLIGYDTFARPVSGRTRPVLPCHFDGVPAASAAIGSRTRARR